MGAEVCAFDHAHRMGEPASHPIAGLPDCLAASLLLAGAASRRRLSLPAGPADPHSGAINRGIKVQSFPNSSAPLTAGAFLTVAECGGGLFAYALQSWPPLIAALLTTNLALGIPIRNVPC